MGAGHSHIKTDAEIAVIQEAIGRAHARWVERWEGEIPSDPSPYKAAENADPAMSDYAEHHLIVDAEGEAVADFHRILEAELAGEVDET